MNTPFIVLGLTALLAVPGAYLLGLRQGREQPQRWDEFRHSLTRNLNRRGVVAAVALPAVWIVLYYAFILHVWTALGRWPTFGEHLTGQWLTLHLLVIWKSSGLLVYSLWLVPVVVAGGLLLRRWRHWAIYAACYGASVGLAVGALFLAPGEFLNWLLD